MYRAVLVEPSYPDNVGFIARLADNFGINEIVLIDPDCGIDAVAESRAVHAQDTLRQIRVVDELAPVLSDAAVTVGTTGIQVDDTNMVRHGVPPREAFDEVPTDADVSLVLGRESTGLTNEELTQCDFVTRIPTRETYPVMNLSHAAAVLFYELHSATDTGTAPVEADRKTALANLFKGTADMLGWNVDRTDAAVRAFKNMLGRAYVTEPEYDLLLGLFGDVQQQLGDTQ